MDVDAIPIKERLKTKQGLAEFIGVPLKFLTYILYDQKTENCYFTFTIPKKSGGERTINAPNDKLKGVQVKLANALWEYQKGLWRKRGISSKLSHAFEKNKSIITNARPHRNKCYVLNLDLEDFFNCFHFGRVRGYFEKNRDFMLSREISTVIAQLTCYNGCLPQGAPTSPIITNLICQIFDMQVLKIAKKYKLTYTRYADDLTFSTNEKTFSDIQETFIEELKKTIKSAGFSINKKKTRLQYSVSQQKVTGLVVNKKVNVYRNFHRKTCAMANSLYTTGDFKIGDKAGTIR